MRKSKNILYNKTILYCEKKALEYKFTTDIINKFKNPNIIPINSYREIFNRKGQNVNLQKQSDTIILAVKQQPYIYKGSPLCHKFSRRNLYYTTCVLNCVYDCSYCYLTGMYSSGYKLFFVNLEDMLNQVKKTCEPGSMLAVSYETDLLALNSLYPYVDDWMDNAKSNPKIEYEIRTKCANIKPLLKRSPLQNIVIAFTCSPDYIIKKYEKGTPNLESRIKAINALFKKGYRIRLCFDPIIRIDNFKTVYSKFFNKVFNNIDGTLTDCSLGAFRMPSKYLKNKRKVNNGHNLIYYPFETKNGVCCYPEKEEEYMISFCRSKLEKYIHRDKIYVL